MFQALQQLQECYLSGPWLNSYHMKNLIIRCYAWLQLGFRIRMNFDPNSKPSVHGHSLECLLDTEMPNDSCTLNITISSDSDGLSTQTPQGI